MSNNQSYHANEATSQPALYADQAFCLDLLKKIDAKVPLQILLSNIPGAGNGLFVAEDVEDGKEILVSCPVVNCVADGFQSLVCDYCYAYKDSMIISLNGFRQADDTTGDLILTACSMCRGCYYCSERCRKMAWNRYHKFECGIYQEKPHLDEKTRALYRLVNIHEHGIISGDEKLALRRLQSRHPSKTPPFESDSVCETARILTKADLGHTEIFRLYCTLDTNYQRIQHPDNLGIGISLDVITSLVNHSCDPNAIVIFEGHSVRLRSLRKLQAGEEITQCYVSLNADVMFRQNQLKAQYCFDCRCDRCEKETKTHKERYSDTILKKIAQSQQQLTDLIADSTRPDYSGFNMFATNVKYIIQQAMHPNPGPWPYDLEPLPSLNLHYAVMLHARGYLTKALRYIVKGLFSLSIRRGKAWVHNIYNLVVFLADAFLKFEEVGDLELNVEGLPTKLQFWYMTTGYIHVLTQAANRTFGDNSRYFQAVSLLNLDMFQPDGLNPDYKTARHKDPAFVHNFYEAQSRLLYWAQMHDSMIIFLGLD